MRNTPRISLFLLGTACAAATAWAQNTASKVDCSQFYKQGVDYSKSLTMDPDDVHQCILRGYDAPSTSRKDNGQSSGVNAEGASGFSYGTIEAPEASPGAMGAAPSVNMKSLQHSFGYPPWPGFPCKLPGGIDLCAAGLTPLPPVNPNDQCPAKDDTTGFYGVKQALGAGSVPLSCGGAVPLATYELTLNKSPDHLAGTEYGSYYVWMYQGSGASFKLTNSGQPVQLPTILCKDKIDPSTNQPMVDPVTHKHVGVRTVELTPPIAQMITYNGTASTLTFRLQPPIDTPTATSGAPVSATEKFLIIPISGGTPKFPSLPSVYQNNDNPDLITYLDCSLETDYYKSISSSQADIVIASAVNSGCEGTPAQCAGLPTAPTPDTSCDTVTIRPKGTYSGTVCDGKTQYVVLDRPSLVYPPNSAMSTVPMEGRTAVLAVPTTGSRIYMQSATELRFGQTAPAVVLNEGGTIVLADKSKLVMQGPATVNAATNQVILSAGGQHLNSVGDLLQTLAAGTSYTLTTPLPVQVSVTRSMNMPLNYLVPTQPSPYVQLPASK